MFEEVLRSAKLAARHGFVSIPPAQDGSKAPVAHNREGGWGQLRDAPYREAELERIYLENKLTGVGVATGACSSNLECLDFDDRSAFSEFHSLCESAGLGELLRKIKDGYCEHTPNGAHLLYRCDEIEGNQKLAREKRSDGAVKALVETRGEGGYVICAPTFGSVNKDGAYEMVSGGWDSVVTLTPEERAQIHTIARSMDQIGPEEVESKDNKNTAIVAPNGERPGDEYNREASWDEVLSKHGWTRLGTFSGVTRWRRPGKNIGMSATTNWGGSDLFYPFTSSTVFEQGRGYSKFGVFAILEHDGDFAAAAHELHNMGFGQTNDPAEDEWCATLQDNIQEYIRQQEALAATKNQFGDPMPEHLLNVPGFLGEFCDFVNATSHKKQPILALAAGISCMSNLIGQRARTASDARSNLYILGVGETGCGKERARQVIKQLMAAVGEETRVCMEDVTSDAAIYRGLKQNPCALALMDEFGKILKAIQRSDNGGGGGMATVANALLRLYGSSSTYTVGKMYAQRDPDKINQPCLSVYGTTVPTSLLRSIDPENLIDGLMNRILIFFSEDDDPDTQDTDGGMPLPQSLISFAKSWIDYPTNPNKLEDMLSDSVNPGRVTATADAKAVFQGMRQRIRDRRASTTVHEDRHAIAAIWSRAPLAAEKLALIRACSIASPQSSWPSIGEADARWGVELAEYLTTKAGRILLERVSANDEDEFSQAIVRAVREMGQASARSIGRTPGRDGVRRHLTSRRGRSVLNDKLSSLVDAGVLRCTKNDSGRTRIYSLA